MRLAGQEKETATNNTVNPTDSNSEKHVEPVNRQTAREYGFSMSIFGTLRVALSAILMLVVVIIVSVTLSGPDAQSAGLLVTTIIGFITMAGAAGAYFGLPMLPTKPYPQGSGVTRTIFLELLTPYREMLFRKRNMLFRKRNMLFLLLAYTISTDTLFALFSITGQLYFLEIRPDTLEYSLYNLAGNLYSFFLTLAFYFLQSRFRWDLGKCLAFGYALILVVPLWGCIGLAGNVDFGFKVSIHYPPSFSVL
jgi:MFS-type transporter involved in bile tolerance (Atg22 family)